MRVTPKTEEQLADEMFGPGTYDFECIEALETTSKAGNEMIEVKHRIYNKVGKSITVRDWLLDAMPHKVRHISSAMGLLAEYQRGDLSADRMVGRGGRVMCVLDQNGYLKVKDYDPTQITAARAPVVAPSTRSAPRRQPAPVGGGDLDDEIPFAPCWQ